MDVTSSNFKYVVSYFWKNDETKKLIESFEYENLEDAINEVIQGLESNTNITRVIYNRGEYEKIIE